MVLPVNNNNAMAPKMAAFVQNLSTVNTAIHVGRDILVNPPTPTPRSSKSDGQESEVPTYVPADYVPVGKELEDSAPFTPLSNKASFLGKSPSKQPSPSSDSGSPTPPPLSQSFQEKLNTMILLMDQPEFSPATTVPTYVPADNVPSQIGFELPPSASLTPPSKQASFLDIPREEILRAPSPDLLAAAGAWEDLLPPPSPPSPPPLEFELYNDSSSDDSNHSTTQALPTTPRPEPMDISPSWREQTMVDSPLF